MPDWHPLEKGRRYLDPMPEEEFRCPVRHARRIRDAHARYPRFFEYGDAESYRKGLERLRKEYDGSVSNS